MFNLVIVVLVKIADCGYYPKREENLISDFELMVIQADTLFIYDSNGQLKFINKPIAPEKYPAPRLFIGRTEVGSVYRFRYDLPKIICNQLEELILLESPPRGIAQPPDYLGTVKKILSSHAPIQRMYAGPAFQFPNSLNRTTGVVNLDKRNAELLEFDFSDWIDELDHIQPCMGVLEEGKVVSICCSVRKSSKAAEAGVETLAPYRGKGYAAHAVAGWAQAVKEKGRIPFYSTSWDNGASQRVAQKLGMIPFGADFNFFCRLRF